MCSLSSIVLVGDITKHNKDSVYLETKANHLYALIKFINGLLENLIAERNASCSKHNISRSSSGEDDMYIAYDLFIIHPILRSTFIQARNLTMWPHIFQHTLLADIFHCSSQLIFKKLTFLCNLLSFFEEVLSGGLHRSSQNMSLLGAPLLLVRWPFAAGIYQSCDLGKDKKYIVKKNRKRFI